MRRVLLPPAAALAGLVLLSPADLGTVTLPPTPPAKVFTSESPGWVRLREELAELPRPRGLVPSIYVMDLQTGQRIDLDAGRVMPAASLIKLPLAVALHAQALHGRVSLDSTVTLRREHKVGGSGDLRRRRVGSDYGIPALVDLMLQKSDNTAANMITELVGLEEVNRTCRNFGLLETRMTRYVMDLSARKRSLENTTTAADMGTLLADLYYRRILDDESCDRILEVLKAQRIRDRLPRLLPPSTVLAHKTGFMNDAVHDTGILYGQNHDYVICVLTAPRYLHFRSAKDYIGRVARTVYRYDRFVKGRGAPAKGEDRPSWAGGDGTAPGPGGQRPGS